MYHKLYFVIIICCLIMVSCNDNYKVINEQTVVVDRNSLKGDTIIKDSVLNLEYSRLSKPDSRGLEINFKLPEEYKNKKLRVIYKVKCKTNQVYTNSCITLAVLGDTNNTVLIWKPMSLRYAYTEVNKWCWHKDSIEVGPVFDKHYFTYVSIFSYLGVTQIEKFDVDTLALTVKCLSEN